MTREELIDAIQWHYGGYGGGDEAAMMNWAMSEPTPTRPDINSVAVLTGPPDKYTDEEMAKFHAFAQRITARYDERFTIRMGANLAIFDKPASRNDGKWLRTKMTWYIGPMWSDTLDEAIEFMERRY